MTTGQIILGVTILMTILSGWLGKQLYGAYTADKTGTKNKIIGGLLGLISVGAVGATSVATYQATGPTVYSIGGGGIIQQGEARFDVTWDPAGLDPVINIDWGNTLINTSYTRTIYIINRSDGPLNVIFTASNWSWSTDDPGKDIHLDFICATTALDPGRFRRVDIKLTPIRWIKTNATDTIFKFNVILTGTVVNNISA